MQAFAVIELSCRHFVHVMFLSENLPSPLHEYLKTATSVAKISGGNYCCHRCVRNYFSSAEEHSVLCASQFCLSAPSLMDVLLVDKLHWIVFRYYLYIVVGCITKFWTDIYQNTFRLCYLKTVL